MNSAFDVVVIGSGAAGLAAALGAANHGVTVALIERSVFLGGECPNTGCIPTQTLLRVAKTYHLLRHADQLGLPPATNPVQYRQIKSFKDSIVAQTAGRHLTSEQLKDQGIQLVQGEASFVDQHTLRIGTKRLTGRQFVIATGSRPSLIAGINLEKVAYLSHREAIELTTLPASLLILGGGPIGVEFALLFAIFGVDVTLIECGERILPSEDSELSKFVTEELTGFGVSVLTNFHSEHVSSQSDTGVTITGQHNGQPQTLSGQKLMVACGMTSNIESLALDRVGVKLTDNHSIQVDDQLRTTVAHIWAVGDVTHYPRYTNTAHYEGTVVAHNLVSREKLSIDFRVLPRALATFTDTASVGKTEAELIKQQRPYFVGRADIAVLGRSLIDQTSNGFIKLLVDPDSGQLLGATIVTPQAHELIHEIALAMKAKLHVKVLTSLLHAYPTYSEGIAIAASDALRQLPVE